MIVITRGSACFNDGRHCRVYRPCDGPIELPGAVEKRWVASGVAAYVPSTDDATGTVAPLCTETTDTVASVPAETKTVADAAIDGCERTESAQGPSYGEWSLSELRDECRARGLHIPSRPSKKQLSEMLEADDAEIPTFYDGDAR